jgi:hypothetical protein
MWVNDLYLSPDCDAYGEQLSSHPSQRGETAQNVIGSLINEFRKPKDEVMALIEAIAPVNNGHELIRLGGSGDGGYLVPNDLEGIGCCYSPGVQHISEFEIQLIHHHGIPSQLIDGSIDQPNVPQDLQDKLRFTKGWIGAYTDLSCQPPIYSLNGWIGASLDQVQGDIILQIDIEDFEWEALLALDMSIQQRMRMIICEFGGLHYMTNSRAFYWMNKVLTKLLSTHDVVHFHPNNCCGKFEYYDGLQIPGLAELTLHRKDRRRIAEPNRRLSLMHPLDHDCVPSQPTLTLTPHWTQPVG